MAARNTRRYRLVLHRSIPVVGMVAGVHQRMLVGRVRDQHRTVRVFGGSDLLRGSELHARQEVVA